ncbi:unnamed protein product [Sphagnum compactum]
MNSIHLGNLDATDFVEMKMPFVDAGHMMDGCAFYALVEKQMQICSAQRWQPASDLMLYLYVAISGPDVVVCAAAVKEEEEDPIEFWHDVNLNVLYSCNMDTVKLCNLSLAGTNKIFAQLLLKHTAAAEKITERNAEVGLLDFVGDEQLAWSSSSKS